MLEKETKRVWESITTHEKETRKIRKKDELIFSFSSEEKLLIELHTACSSTCSRQLITVNDPDVCSVSRQCTDLYLHAHKDGKLNTKVILLAVDNIPPQIKNDHMVSNIEFKNTFLPLSIQTTPSICSLRLKVINKSMIQYKTNPAQPLL